ncbi:hypothetical protein PV10_00738 [Exophiala mesophila]|uniref:Uncharacterized protein n=1 Tax=Exophiala mesophila TaxID=212818 RepID=A0A0D1X548_EXOME|nr:uncharacterized protein PV10_00738 [Exophiala mesophila]KIV96925.1 hypothetical protein PV10_00738 [Exophiala mesophila]
MSQPILLIIGAGPNIGASVAKSFASKGYRIALASRKTPSFEIKDSLHVTVDLANPSQVPSVFETVKQKWGASPSVVVYNAAVFFPDQGEDVLSQFDFKKFETSNAINTTSVISALQQSVAGFKTLPASASKTFIFTGNMLNSTPAPGFLLFGAGKATTAYFIRHLVQQKSYQGDGIKFYYTDQRQSNGAPMGTGVEGDAAGIEYLKLAERQDQGPWDYTFVKGEGYKDFSSAN